MPERIVFVHPDGTPTGQTGDKLASHTDATKLHLAFSCYIFNLKDNKLLVTKRADSKKVWPGVWTNSVCGHPGPGESLRDAIVRRAHYELGYERLLGIKCLLPDYTYKTPPFNGIVEHEFCPVYIAYTDDDPLTNPEEVADYQWLDIAAYEQVLSDVSSSSYWARDQYRFLAEHEAFWPHGTDQNATGAK